MKIKYLIAFTLSLCSLPGISQTQPNFVDFEDGMYMGNHTHSISGSTWENDDAFNTYFDNAYHVQFFNANYNNGYSSPSIPKYALIGEEAMSSDNERVAFRTTSVGSVDNACTALSDPNSDADNPFNATNTNPGCWFLTDDDGLISTSPLDLIIEYDETAIQCTIASGFIYDLDNSGNSAEGWQLDIYSTTSTPSTPDNTIYLLANGWSGCTGCTSGINANQAYNPSSQAIDGGAAYWELQTNGDPIDYIVMTYIGDINRNVGVAFDNFYYCSRGDSGEVPPVLCDAEAGFDHTTVGCGTQFSNTSSSAAQTIIGYQWDFGDGTTSTDANPFHYYGGAGAYNVTLTIFGFDGSECCSSTISRVIEVGECVECEAEIDFAFSEINEECDRCLIDFSAIVQNQSTPVLGYYWTIDGVPYTGQNLQHLVSGSAYVCLTVVFAADSGECCTKTICAEIECGSNGLASESGGAAEASRKNAFGEQPLSTSAKTEETMSGSEKNRLTVFPNPGNEFLTLQFDSDGSERLQVELVGVDGRVFQLQGPQTTREGAQQLSFDISGIPSGMYLARVRGVNMEMSEMISILH